MDSDNPTTQAFLSIALISFSPILVLLGLPVNNPILMRRFLALAAGCLLSDAFLHLIPESDGLQQAIAAAHTHNAHHHHHHSHAHPAERALHPPHADDHDHHHHSMYDTHNHHEHDGPHHRHHHHHHEHDDEPSSGGNLIHENAEESQHHHHHHDSTTGFRVLWGILIFFFIERILFVLKSSRESLSESTEKLDEPSEDFDDKNSADSKPSSRQATNKKRDEKSSAAQSSEQQTNNNNVQHHHHHNHIHTFGILNLIADFMHNFTDGLAIGASFLTNTKLGMSTTVAIFLHEIPHEISDYAILIQSGFSKTKAIWLQCLTAVGAFSGCFVAVYAGNLDSNANAWILPITAGGFIYIAMVHLLPQLKSSNFKNTVLELSLLVFGVMLMLGVSYFE